MAHAGDEEGKDLDVSRWGGEGRERRETEAGRAAAGPEDGDRGRWLALLQVVDQLQVLVEQVAEVGDGEGVHPVVVGGVTVALLHHQAEPGRGGEGSSHPHPTPKPARGSRRRTWGWEPTW